jgi:hypothetical protein
MAGKVEGFRFPDEELALSQTGGVQTDIPWALANAPASSVRDYEDLLARHAQPSLPL